MKWQDVKEAIQERWPQITDNELMQADGITELASLISRKAGEPRPNVLHELIHVLRNQDEDHPILEQYLAETSAARHQDIGPEDDGANKISPNELQ